MATWNWFLQRGQLIRLPSGGSSTSLILPARRQDGHSLFMGAMFPLYGNPDSCNGLTAMRTGYSCFVPLCRSFKDGESRFPKDNLRQFFTSNYVKNVTTNPAGARLFCFPNPAAIIGCKITIRNNSANFRSCENGPDFTGRFMVRKEQALCQLGRVLRVAGGAFSLPALSTLSP